MTEFHESTRPYPGLRPFEPWEGELFFGREEHTNRLLDIMQQQRFLAVIGPSGSGKSSLVRAGLLPALPLGCIGTGSDWRTVVMRPGNRPMQCLAQSLLKRSALGLELVGAERLAEAEQQLTSDVAMIEAELRRGPLGLFNVVKNARSQQVGAEPFNLLILIDQFEEIFTYADAGGRQADEAEAFVNLLLAQRLAKDELIFIVMTMRTDFLGNCVRFLELPDAINRAQYLTPRLTREQIERVITGPAQLFDGEVEQTLVMELINEVSDDSDQLPILQHALARMWDKALARDASARVITWQDFYAVGGIAKALSSHADEILASLSPQRRIEEPLSTLQQAAEVLFRAITDQRRAEVGGQAVRRAQTLANIEKWSGVPWQEFAPVITAYAQEGINFLHLNAAFGRDAVVDISHEALIRQWQRLQDWVAQEARFADEFKRLREHTEQWLRDEQHETGSGSLLTGANLLRALEWQAGEASLAKTDAGWRPNARWAERYQGRGGTQIAGFDDVMRFIDLSNAARLREKQRELRHRKIQTGLTIFCAVFMCIAIGFAVKAKHNQDKANIVLTKLLWSPLDFTSPSINDKQAAGLLALAQTEDARKQIFLEQLLHDKTLAEYFSNQPEAIIRALAGVDPGKVAQLRRYFALGSDDVGLSADQDTQKIFRVARLLALTELESEVDVQALLDATASSIPYSVESGFYLKEALIKSIAQVPASRIDGVVDVVIAAAADQNLFYPDYSTVLPTLITKMPASVLTDKILAAMQDGNKDKDSLSELLLKVAENVPEHEVMELSHKLLAKMKTAPQPADFADALSRVAKRATPTQAAILIDKLLAALQDVKEPNKPYNYADSLTALAEKTLGSEVLPVIDKLLAAMQQSALAESIAPALARVSKNTPENQAQALVDKFLALSRAAKEMDKPAYYFSKAALAAAENTPIQEAGVVFEKLLSASKELPQREELGSVLLLLAKKLPEDQAPSLFAKLLDEMQAVKTPEGMDYFTTKLVAVAERLPEQQAPVVFEQLVSLLKAAKEPVLWKDFAHVLTPVCAKLPKAQALDGFDALLAVMQPLKKSTLREDLGLAFAKLGNRLPVEQVPLQLEKLVAIMKDPHNAYQQNSYVPALEAVASQAAVEQVPVLIDSIYAAMKNVQEPDKAYFYSVALPDLVAKASEQEAVPIFDKLLSTMKVVDDASVLSDLAKALQAVAGRVSEAQAHATVNKLLVAMQVAKEPDKPGNYSASLAVAAEKAPIVESLPLFNHLYGEMKGAKVSEQQQDLAHTLMVAFEKAPQDRILELLNPFLVLVKETRDSRQLQYFAEGLPVVLAHAMDTEAKPIAQKLVTAILNSEDHNQIDMLCSNLLAVANRLPSADAAAVLFKSLESPLTPRDKLSNALREKFPETAPGKAQGFWRLVEWGASLGEAKL